MKIKLLTCFLITFLFSVELIGQSVMFDLVTPSNSTGSNPWGIASGYFNNDAYLDIAIGTDASTVEVFINNSDGGSLNGTFAAGVTLTATAPNDLLFVEGITVGSINSDVDAFIDIIATSYSNNNLVWFEGNGDGTFEDGVEITEGLEGAGAVELVDLDNNGDLDVIVSNYGPTNGSVAYMLGNGDGTFGIIRYIVAPASGLGPVEFAIGNFDNQDGLDGDIDVVVTFLISNEVIVYDNRMEEDGLDGSGNVPFVAYPVVDDTNGNLFNSVSFADVDDTGGLDILISDNQPGVGNPNIAWFSYNDSDVDGNPLITTSWAEANITTSITRTATANAADFDGANGNDLLVTNGRSTNADLIWFESDGFGGFSSEYVINDTNPGIFDVEIQDFDNDGDLDIATISYLSDNFAIFLNDRFTLGVDEQSLEPISIYPNPTTNILNFKGTFTNDLVVSVYDVLGKRVIYNTVKHGTSLDVSKLNNGVYIIKFEDYDNTYKFVKN